MFRDIIPLYNKTRNYLTQKPYSNEKIKINFACPTLLNGWDLNKEEANLGVILLKDEKILFRNNESILQKKYLTLTIGIQIQIIIIRKWNINCCRDQNKMLPKVFFFKVKD